MLKVFVSNIIKSKAHTVILTQNRTRQYAERLFVFKINNSLNNCETTGSIA